MTKQALYIAASLLSLVALALLVIGLGATDILWQVGLGLVALAMLISFATRWLGREMGEQKGKGQEGQAGGSSKREQGRAGSAESAEGG